MPHISEQHNKRQRVARSANTFWARNGVKPNKPLKVFQRNIPSMPLSPLTVECGVCHCQVRIYESNGALAKHRVGTGLLRDSWPCAGGGLD